MTNPFLTWTEGKQRATVSVFLGKNSPSSPAVRDLLDRHQASLGRSQSFSHQQPSRSHIMRLAGRIHTHTQSLCVLCTLIYCIACIFKLILVCLCFRTGSAMERRAITPPVGSPVGRPLYLPPQEKAVLSLDKIAKRECKVLVLDHIS